MNVSLNAFLSLVALAALGFGLGGCASVSTFNSKHDTTFGKKRQVQNVYEEPALPGHLRRVALLPVYKGRYDHIEMASIEENFTLELGKRNLFELVTLTPESMEEIFGQARFSSVESLPTKLLSRLHEVYAVDGVMLLDLTYFNAYQPVGIGLRAKLLDGHTGDIVWASDELFDSANPAVSNAARRYFQSVSVNQYPLHETQTVLHSPTRFSKYVAHSLFATL